MEKRVIFLLIVLAFHQIANGQFISPKHYDNFPVQQLNEDLDPFQEHFALIEESEVLNRAINTFPPKEAVRSMAEWEEIEAITITWADYFETLSNIVRHAQHECKVYINCVSAEKVKSDLELYSVDYNENVIFLENQNFNTVWIRDYGPNSAYLNDVDSLIFVDWVYNREQRPEDDILPEAFSEQIDVQLYQTSEGKFQLTATGGNFMSDGLGNGFSSRLVVDENQSLHEDEIDNIMHQFLGITNYIKFDKLDFDGIHHIDMHMKLLDEERFIFGEYPEGEGDHDIIEANIEHLLATELNAFGEPYEIIRVPMPPDNDKTYPSISGEADFRTYTNALFINKTILVPTYQELYDSTALRIWRETMPGYNIVGIRCNEMISAFGAIHCVTKEIGVLDPLRIVFQKIKDQEEPKYDGYTLTAKVQHRSGIASAKLFYRKKGTLEYDQLTMTLVDANEDLYSATIPDFIDRGSVEYFVKGEANSGKVINRPQPAPAGYYSFDVNNSVTSTTSLENVFDRLAFPNPSSGIVCIPVDFNESVKGDLGLFDVHGKLIQSIFSGKFEAGNSKHFINVSEIPSGLYALRLTNNKGVFTQKLVVE